MNKYYFKPFNLLIYLSLFSGCVNAQDLEPRAYANAPVGMNFLLLGYQYSEGALFFDPALPVTDAKSNIDMGLVAYIRSLDITGKSAKAGFVLPYAELQASGNLNGVFKSREDSGLADPLAFFSINLSGAPALGLNEFISYQQDVIVGMTFKLSMPFGDYEQDKLINIGTNRWAFETELGLSKAINHLILEAAASVTCYADNDEFNNDQTRQQESIYAIQGHVIYSFPEGIWASWGATYYTGGRTTIDGVDKNDLQQNWRTGFTLVLPVSRYHSIKLYANSGVSTRTGSDFDAIGIAWQTRWGGGL